MEKFYLERPSLKRKDEAIEYINEFIRYNSEIHGVGGLNKYLDNYEQWLEHLDNMRKIIEIDNLVPSETFFLIRENDNKIVGMIDIRLALNEILKKYGGNIGYSIRPTERKKGYNKINLYLGLIECQKQGIKEVLLDCDKNNLGSSKTMKALGGELLCEYLYEDIIAQKYSINVDKSIEKYKEKYGDKVKVK